MKKILLYLILSLSSPLIAQQVFNGCPMIGDAKNANDQRTNTLKNRYEFPTASDFDASVSMEALLRPGNDEGRFSEENAAQITGYVVKVSKKGSSETCNCHATQPIFTDTHIDVAIDADHTGKRELVVVEVTPRIRAIMADRGEDWSHQALQSLTGKYVTFTGWLLWDWRHKKDAENTDPGDARQNWRATCWELHPVTGIEVLDDIYATGDPEGEEDGWEEYEYITPTSGPVGGYNSAGVSKSSSGPKSPSDILSIILLGGLLGVAGQGVRIAVGLKKLNDIVETKEEFDSKFDAKRLVVSVLYGVTIGIIAGIFMAVDNIDKTWDKSTIMATIAAGYAGADFIEGFISKNLPSTKDTSKKTTITTKIVTGTPPEGGIPQ